MTKKSTKHSTRTLEQFKEELSSQHYNTLVGARRGAAYLPEKDREAALKLVARTFGVSVDEPGEATRGVRRKASKPGGKKKAVRRAAAALPIKGKKKKLGKKTSRKAARKSADPEAAPVEASAPSEPSPEVEEAEVAAPVKKRAASGSKKKTAEKFSHPPMPVIGDGPLSQLGIASSIIPLVDQALETIAKAKAHSGGTLDITTGLQDVLNTTGAALRELQQYLPRPKEPELVPGGPLPELSTAVYGDGVRPTNHQALQEAAAAAGLPAAVS